MSWKAIDSRANTAGTALYADTVFYNKTNHDYLTPNSTADNLKVDNLTVNDTLTVASNVTADSGGVRANSLQSTGDTTVHGSLEMPYGGIQTAGATGMVVNVPLQISGAALTVGGRIVAHQGLDVDGEVSVTSGNVNVTGGDITTDRNITATNSGGGTITGNFLVSNGNVTANSGTITGNSLVSKGDVTCFSTSDRRLKEEITQIENAGETVDKLKGVRFKWREDWFKENEVILAHQDDMGFIAQEVEEVIPELVTEKGNGYKGVAYHKLVPLLLEAIKDLRQDVQRLQGEIKEIRDNHD